MANVTVKVYNHFEVTISGELKEGGSRVTPVEISVGDNCYDVRTQIEADYRAETLWQTGWGGVATFEFLWFLSDQDVLLDLVYDYAGTDKHAIIKIKADVPFLVASDDMKVLDDGTDPIGDGSGTGTITTGLDQIDQINVQNNVNSEGDTAKVRLVLLGADVDPA